MNARVNELQQLIREIKDKQQGDKEVVCGLPSYDFPYESVMTMRTQLNAFPVLPWSWKS